MRLKSLNMTDVHAVAVVSNSAGAGILLLLTSYQFLVCTIVGIPSVFGVPVVAGVLSFFSIDTVVGILLYVDIPFVPGVSRLLASLLLLASLSLLAFLPWLTSLLILEFMLLLAFLLLFWSCCCIPFERAG
jgi:hypothetical protein